MKRILIVDDNISISKMVKEALTLEGYEIVEATDGVACLEKAKQEKPDLILLDIFMPIMNGWETCKALKADPETKHIPVVFATSSDQEENKKRARSLGAVHYLIKPYNLDQLAEVVKKLLKG